MSSTSHCDPSNPSSDAAPDTSAAVAIQSGMEDLLVSVLEREVDG